MKRALQLAGIITLLSCATAELYRANLEREAAKFTIAAKGEIHATADVAKKQVEQTGAAMRGTIGKADALAEASAKLVGHEDRVVTTDSVLVGRLIQASNANLNCPHEGVWLQNPKHKTSRIDCTQVGVLVQVARTLGKVDGKIDPFMDAVIEAANNAKSSLGHLDAVLGNEDIPLVLKALRESAQHFDGTTVNLEQMTADGKRGMAVIADILDALRKPQDVPRYVKAVRLMLQLLGVTANLDRARDLLSK